MRVPIGMLNATIFICISFYRYHQFLSFKCRNENDYDEMKYCVEIRNVSEHTYLAISGDEWERRLVTGDLPEDFLRVTEPTDGGGGGGESSVGGGGHDSVTAQASATMTPFQRNTPGNIFQLTFACD